MKPTQRRRLQQCVIGFVVCLGVSLLWDNVAILRDIEQFTLDNRYKHFNRVERASDEVVVVDIDEQSIKRLAPVYGRWPWRREAYHALLEFIADGGPKIVLFDVLFTEPMLGSSDDEQLGRKSEQVGVVSHAAQLLDSRANEGQKVVPMPESIRERFALSLGAEVTWQSNEFVDFALPTQAIASRSPKFHLVNFEGDRDGVYRRAPLLFSYQGHWYPSLVFSAILAGLQSPSIGFHNQRVSLKGEKSQRHLNVDSRGFLPVHFYRSDRDIKSIPFFAVIDSKSKLDEGLIAEDPKTGELIIPNASVQQNEFRDKIVLVGASAVGLADLKATPIHSMYPGVKVHATAISNVLKEDFLVRLPWVIGLLITLVLVLSTYASMSRGENRRIVGPLILLALYLGACLVLFRYASLALPVAMPLTAMIGAILHNYAYLVFIERAQRKKMQDTLSKYLSPVVTQQLVANGMDPRAEVGRFEELTVLFADIRNFTSLTENNSPDRVVSGLNHCLAAITTKIFEHHGTLDKFMGDAVMAFWGAPISDPDHAVKALRCGFAIQSLMGRGQGIAFKLGVGVNTGRMIVGNIGSEKRLDYTVIGDNVNLGSRIEGLTRLYQLSFLIGENTYAAVRDTYSCRFIDKVQVKGREQPVGIYQPIGLHGELTAQRAKPFLLLFSQAIEAYQSKFFEVALKLFHKANEAAEGIDGPCRVYIERCKTLIEKPPDEWEGVYVATRK